MASVSLRCLIPRASGAKPFTGSQLSLSVYLVTTKGGQEQAYGKTRNENEMETGSGSWK